MMRTEMTNSPPHSGSSLKGGATKALKEESARVGAGSAQSAQAEGEDAGGDFSALLLSLGGDAANPAQASTNPPSPDEDVRAADTVREAQSPETRQTMPTPAEAAVGPTLGALSRPLLGAVLSTVSGDVSGRAPTAPDPNKPAALPQETSDGDGFISSAAVAQQANAGGADLSQRDSKNHMKLAQGHGVNGQSHASLVTDQPELLKLSASALEGGAQKSLQKIATTMEGGAVSAPSFQLTDLRTAGASAPEVGSSAATATTVAQQVNYWIGRDVQSAELRLDGLGHSPVEVSISMQGREAHVEFRAEQIEARQLIEQAMPQLKALLQSEGLALAGVSIGSSAAEASFSQAKQPKQPLRQGAARVAELGLMDAVGRTRPGTGRALDLFV
jgi:flagellar hook-length control protein FliK